MYVVPKIPISGRILPSGTLKERGAFGTLFRRISTSICAKIYEIIQNTEPTRIKNEIAEEELSLIKAKIKIVTLTNIIPKNGTFLLFVLAKNCGIIFIFAMPWQILERPLTVEFCVLITARAATIVIQYFPAPPRRFWPYNKCGAADSVNSAHGV